jgi:hypothetical protein
MRIKISEIRLDDVVVWLKSEGPEFGGMECKTPPGFGVSSISVGDVIDIECHQVSQFVKGQPLYSKGDAMPYLTASYISNGHERGRKNTSHK